MKFFKALWHKFFAWLFETNSENTPPDVILEQMLELRPLPLGSTEFDVWADRIISGALVTGASVESQKFALADMILHLKATEDHMHDMFFIKSLRKVAVNQVATAKREEIRNAAKARLAAEESAKLQQNLTVEVTTVTSSEGNNSNEKV